MTSARGPEACPSGGEATLDLSALTGLTEEQARHRVAAAGGHALTIPAAVDLASAPHFRRRIWLITGNGVVLQALYG